MLWSYIFLKSRDGDNRIMVVRYEKKAEYLYDCSIKMFVRQDAAFCKNRQASETCIRRVKVILMLKNETRLDSQSPSP